MAVTDKLVDLLMGRATGKIIEPPPAPKSWAVRIEANDTQEMITEGSVATHDVAGAVLGIDYIDADGNATSRRIRPIAFKPANDDWVLHAVCMERRAIRTFLASRIQGAVDLRSGEIFDEPSEILNGILGVTYGNIETPRDATRLVWRQYPEAINVLVFLARCDGQHHPSETESILQFADTMAPAPGIDVDHAMELLQVAWVDEHHYSASLAKIARQGEDHLYRVARYARKIIDADGALSEDEVRFATQLDQFMR